MNGYDQKKYDQTVNELKQIVSGVRGWLSITAASKASGVPKAQIRIVAQALGLEVKNSHGHNGMVAFKNR